MVRIYLKLLCTESIRDVQDEEPTGTLVEVVLCMPFTHLKMIVSPTFALMVFGLNAKFLTFTVILVAKIAVKLKSKKAVMDRIFFIKFVFFKI